jgi:hypothetical protein
VPPRIDALVVPACCFHINLCGTRNCVYQIVVQKPPTKAFCHPLRNSAAATAIFSSRNLTNDDIIKPDTTYSTITTQPQDV